ncbi:MAG: tRNA adenosine(34) deaminase TadA [Acidobacteriota bacterium]
MIRIDSVSEDERYMKMAFEEAYKAKERDEVPIGAIIIKNGEVIGRGFNRPILTSDPTAHAEIIAMREAALVTGNYRLVDSTLYVTIEPCLMCLGAMIHARIKRLVYGSDDPKAGAVGFIETIERSGANLNHHLEISSGILKRSCAGIIENFFLEKRKLTKKK